MVSQVAETCLPVAIRKQIDLGFELSPAFVHGNALLLQEMLGNLLDNAIRLTPAGGFITVSCGQSEATAWVSVEDSGNGIPETEYERVFERFYQLPGNSRDGDGNGLGLAIVQQIARQHGGKAFAGPATKLGGVRFSVTLSASQHP